jgi:hypothetical protein
MSSAGWTAIWDLFIENHVHIRKANELYSVTCSNLCWSRCTYLIKSYEAWGKPEEAKKWRAKLL